MPLPMSMRGMLQTSLWLITCLSYLPFRLSASKTCGSELGFSICPKPSGCALRSAGGSAVRRVSGLRGSNSWSRTSTQTSLKMAVKMPSEKALQTLIAVMENNRDNGAVQGNACEALLEISSRSELAHMTILEVGLEPVLAAIAAHPENDDVQKPAAKLLQGKETGSSSQPPHAEAEVVVSSSREFAHKAREVPSKSGETVDVEAVAVETSKSAKKLGASADGAGKQAKSAQAEANDETKGETGEADEKTDTFKGRISPFAKDIDPDLEPEAFRDALRDNIYAFQGKSLGNQLAEGYMDNLNAPDEEEKPKGKTPKRKPRRSKYDLMSRGPPSRPKGSDF